MFSLTAGGQFALSLSWQPVRFTAQTASSGNEELRTDGRTNQNATSRAGDGKQSTILSQNFGDHLSGSTPFLTRHSPLEHLFLLCNFAEVNSVPERHSYGKGTCWAQTLRKSVKRSVKTAIHDKLLWRRTAVVTQSVVVNLLKPTGHVMHQQFNIQQLYVLPTLCLCVLYLSENRQRLVPLTA